MGELEAPVNPIVAREDHQLLQLDKPEGVHLVEEAQMPGVGLRTTGHFLKAGDEL